MIHIHSTYSDGSGSVEEIAEVANTQHLDYLVVTDHDSLQGRRDGKAGWHGKTLVLMDEEVSTNKGHELGLRLQQEIPRLQDPQWTIEAVSAQGGLGFVAHPFWPRRPWKKKDVSGMTGIEIYSAVQDVSEANPLWLALSTVFIGSEFSLLNSLEREEESLFWWDQLLSRGEPVVGIGSPDAHGLRRFGLHLGPYSTMLKLVRNHLLVHSVSEKEIYDALSRGHCFVAHDLVAEATGFTFVALSGNSVCGVMGDKVKLQKNLRLYAYLPSPGTLVLLKDGRRLHTLEGQHGLFPVDSPGVYRLEAARKGTPWIYSNPLYVVE